MSLNEFRRFVSEADESFNKLYQKFTFAGYVLAARAIRKAHEQYLSLEKQPQSYRGMEEELEKTYREFLGLVDKKRAILVKNTKGKKCLFSIRAENGAVKRVFDYLRDRGHNPIIIRNRSGAAVSHMEGYNVSANIGDDVALDLFALDGVLEVRSPSITYKFD